MITTPILEEIYAAQKQFDNEANHNLQEYVRQAHQHVSNLAKEYGFKLTYGTIIGGNVSLHSKSDAK